MVEIARLRSTDEIEALFERSRQVPVLVFKHSLTCPISHHAYDEFRRFAASGAAGAELALIEIQNARPASAAFAERSGVRHESPQAILLRDGDVAWHASHGAIRQDALAAALAG